MGSANSNQIHTDPIHPTISTPNPCSLSNLDHFPNIINSDLTKHIIEIMFIIYQVHPHLAILAQKKDHLLVLLVSTSEAWTCPKLGHVHVGHVSDMDTCSTRP